MQEQGEGRRLAWVMPGAPSVEQRAANERLCRLIVTRTRLPLVVISAATLSLEDYGVVESEPSPLDPPTSPGVARFFWITLLGPFLVTLVLSGFGALLQHGWLPC